MSDFPKALPHGPIQEIFPDVFVVTGGFRPGPGVTITRNMTVVRRGGDLILFNSVRLGEAGEAELAKLGKVAHVVRLSAFHGADDPYYAHRYGVPVWAPKGMAPRGAIADRRELEPHAHPVDRASVFLCEKGKLPEAAMLLDDAGGVLITCDSFQNWTSREGCSLPARAILALMGFGPNTVGPMWLKAMGPAVRDDLKRMANLPFRHVVPGHGTVLRDAAPDGVRTAIGKIKAKA